MLIIAGHDEVDPDAGDEALAVVRGRVTRAREAPRCLDLAITADSVGPTRINNFERWGSQEALGLGRRVRHRGLALLFGDDPA